MDDFDPEMMREFNENLNSMSSSMGGMSTAFNDLVQTISAVASAQSNLSKSIDTNSAAQIANAQALGATTEAAKAHGSSVNKVDESMKSFDKAIGLSLVAVANFSQALTGGVEGFSKYGSSLKGLGDATSELTSSMGPLGRAAGMAFDALTKIGALMLEQTDAQNRFVKDMNLMGGITEQTSNQMTDLARDAGFAARDLDKLSPIILSTANGLASFGAGTSDGLKKFLEVLALNNNDEVEAEMRRYGYTLEEANEQQAYYIQLQRTSGINLNAQNMSAKEIQKRSLDYAKTLVELSELTGLSATQLKEEQNQIASDLRNKIRNIRDQNDIARIEKELQGEMSDSRRQELNDRKDDLANQLKIRQDLAQDLAGLGPGMASKLMNIIGTGAFDENTQALANMGFEAGQLKEQFSNLTAGSAEYDEAVAEVTSTFVDGVRNNVDRFGKSMELASNASEIGAAVGIDGESSDRVIALGVAGEEAEKRRLEVGDKFSKATAEGADAQKDTAAGLQVLERNIRTAADEALDSFNPFNGALKAGTIGLIALTAAAGTAVIALAGMSKMGGAGAILSKLFGKTARNRAGVKAAGGAGNARSLMKYSKVGGGIVGAGMAVYGAADEADDKRKQAERDYFTKSEGVTDESDLQRLKDERDLAKSNANLVGGTKGAGGALGAAGGASLGATIGTFILPGIGTAIGGLIGGGLGAILGSAAGEMAGVALSADEQKAFEASDEEIFLMSEDEKAEWQKNYDQAIQAQTDAKEAAEKQLAATEAGLSVAVESGLYDKDWIGDSELDLDVLKEMRDSGTLTEAMLEGILADSDLSAKDTALVQTELKKLVAAEDDKKSKSEKKDEDKEQSFAEMSMAELWAHYDEVAVKEQELADQNLAALDASSKVVEEMTGSASGTGTGTVGPDGVIVTDQNQNVDSLLEEVKVSSTKVAALIESPVIKDKVTAETKPMNEATKEFVAYVDSDEGKAEIAQNEKIRAERMAEMNTSAEDQLLAKEGQYQEVLDTGQYKGKDASESVMGQAKQYLASIEETKTKRMAMEQFGLPNNPKVDIEPELDAEEGLSVEEFKQKQLAQNKTEPAEMSEYEKQSLAMLGQQSKLLGDIKSTSSDSADSQLKIATYSSV
jgi:hypothetical protein